jgi:hypothetical protein
MRFYIGFYALKALHYVLEVTSSIGLLGCFVFLCDLVDRFNKKSAFKNVCDFTLFVTLAALFTLLFVFSVDRSKPSKLTAIIQDFENKHNKEIREIQQKYEEASTKTIGAFQGSIFLLTFFGCWLFFIVNSGLLLGLTLGLFAALIIASIASALGPFVSVIFFVIGFFILLLKALNM